MATQMANEIRCAVPAGDICGEGAVWLPEQSALYWADINRFLVHQFTPATSSTRTWMFNEPVTSVNLTEDNEAAPSCPGVPDWTMVSPQSSSCRHNLTGCPLRPKCDSMMLASIREARSGRAPCAITLARMVRNWMSLFQTAFSIGLIPTGQQRNGRKAVRLSNTVAWSPDRKRFYFGDTRANTDQPVCV